MILSLIVPLYNYASRVSYCLDSLLQQGLDADDYEIIVVNDGSTDNSAEVVNRYCDKHPNVRLINKQNAGLGYARNTGIDAARGEYIGFVDADDFLTVGACAILLAPVIESNGAYNPEIIDFGLNYVYDCHPIMSSDCGSCKPTYSGTIGDYYKSRPLTPTCYTRLYKRDFLDGIRFTDIKHAEDLEFSLKVYEHCDATFMHIDLRAYCYLRHVSSMTGRQSKAKIIKIIDAFKQIAADIASNSQLRAYPVKAVEAFVSRYLGYEAAVRLLYTDFTLAETKQILSGLRQTGLLPIAKAPGRIGRLVDFLSRHPLLMRLASPPYRHIYLNYLKK